MTLGKPRSCRTPRGEVFPHWGARMESWGHFHSSEMTQSMRSPRAGTESVTPPAPHLAIFLGTRRMREDDSAETNSYPGLPESPHRHVPAA